MQAQKAKKDTAFLRRSEAGDEYNAIFIDSSLKSRWYESVAFFKINNDAGSTYRYSLKELYKNGGKFKKNNIKGIPLKWVNIVQYNNRFYAYKPCDFMYHKILNVTDTTLNMYSEEGWEPFRINSFSAVSKNEFVINVTGPSIIRSIKLTIIDQEKGIAVEEEVSNDGSRFNLLVDADKIRKLPIIINYCPTQKAFEFDFPEPDWKALISQAK
jgi:hypothetical protein